MPRVARLLGRPRPARSTAGGLDRSEMHRYNDSMGRRTVFVPYRPKNILSRGRRADHWFWSRYSAYPYVGCQHGCLFCYCRERKYCPFDDVADFDHVVQGRESGPELLGRLWLALSRCLCAEAPFRVLSRTWGLLCR